MRFMRVRARVGRAIRLGYDVRQLYSLKGSFMRKLALAAALLLSIAAAPIVYAAPQSCEQLSQLALPNSTVTSAQTMAAGTFTPPPSVSPWLAGDPGFYKTLPAFCRVMVEDKPTPDSDIKIEVWLPSSGWNGKFRGQGNGGFAGEIGYAALGSAVQAGYASAATDTGHATGATDSFWAIGHPEKVLDFAYRAIHDMTVIGKAVTKAFYGDAPQHTYFSSCSNGGRQALMEVQRYAGDYDGVIAGAPANYWTHLLGGFLYNAQATTLDPASYIPVTKIPAIAKAVNAACDAQDGVTDGVLNDPRKCHFDPASMLCKTGDSDSCLTQRQITTLTKLYDGSRFSNGEQIFPGYLPGAEDGQAGWGLWITGPAPGQSLLFAFGIGFFSSMQYEQKDWAYQKANVDEAVHAADKKFGNVLNATQTDLKSFESHGGKLIIYHGWDDAAISALNSINYYNAVVGKMAGANVTERRQRVRNASAESVTGQNHNEMGSAMDSMNLLTE